MGGTTFECTANGATAQEAFNAAVERAQYDHGHAGYTGTIAECDGCVVIQQEKLTLPLAQALASKLINDCDPRIDDKWGPAGAIPLVDDGWYFFGWAAT